MRRLIERARTYKRLLVARKCIPDRMWSRALVAHQIAPQQIEWHSADGDIRLKSTGTRIYRQFIDLCLPELGRIERLSRLGATFSKEGSDLVIELCGVRMRVQTREEFFILEELYLRGCYSVHIDGDPLILDVGANVAYTSLLLASRFPTGRVIGFELMPPTFEAARHNLSLNPDLARRIELRCIGASDANTTLDLEYCASHRGSTGLYGVSHREASSEPLQTIRAHVHDVAELFAEARGQYPDRPVVVKIDCEGEEYNILRRLQSAGDLASISVLMIEWHRRHESHDPNRLCRDMQRAGFTTLFTESALTETGMLYCFRCNAPDTVKPLESRELVDQHAAGLTARDIREGAVRTTP